MARLHFPAGMVCRQILHSLTSAQHAPTPAQVLDPAYRHDGRNPLLGTADDIVSINPLRDVDWTRIPPALHLVGTPHGLALLSAGFPVQYHDDGRIYLSGARETDPHLHSQQTISALKRHALGEDRRQVALDLKVLGRIISGLEATRSRTSALVALDARDGVVTAAAEPVVSGERVWGMPFSPEADVVPNEGVRRTLAVFLAGALAAPTSVSEECADSREQ